MHAVFVFLWYGRLFVCDLAFSYGVVCACHLVCEEYEWCVLWVMYAVGCVYVLSDVSMWLMYPRLSGEHLWLMFQRLLVPSFPSTSMPSCIRSMRRSTCLHTLIERQLASPLPVGAAISLQSQTQ